MTTIPQPNLKESSNSIDHFTGIYQYDKQLFIHVNIRGLQLFEFNSLQAFTQYFNEGKIWFWRQENTKAYLTYLGEKAAKEGNAEEYTFFQTPSGRIFPGWLMLEPISGEEFGCFMVTIKPQFGPEYPQQKTFSWDAAIDNASTAVLLTDAQGIIKRCNAFTENLFGFSREVLTGQPVEFLFPPELGQPQASFYFTSPALPMEKNRAAALLLTATRRNNNSFPAVVRLNHYANENGEMEAIAFISDLTGMDKTASFHGDFIKNTVTEQELLLQELLMENRNLRISLERERQKTELKSEFVSIVSHEFRTPLSTILSSCSLAMKYANPDAAIEDKRKKHLERIQEAVKNLTFLLDEFLSLGKLEEGLIRANLQPVGPEQLQGWIEETVQEIALNGKPGQTVSLTIDLAQSVRVDLALLRNILINLLSNAIKYSAENTPIAISCETGHTWLEIAVSDRGIGIAPQEISRLTERFFRARNAAHFPGTGLGLHIVDRYLEMMNGKMEIHSHLNEGSTFTIFIPLKDKQNT